jgi:defect in organelle trafficking protein DotC
MQNNFASLYTKIGTITKTTLKTKTAVLAMVIVCAGAALVGCASSDDPQDFYRISNVRSTTSSGVSSIRFLALKQTSRSMGAQAGLAWRSQYINRMLEQQKYTLDQVFNFNYLILNSRVLPPVLTEGQNLLNLSDNQTIRIAENNYQIVSPPRFITTPPTWRTYLWMNYKKPELPNQTLQPKNSSERYVWDYYARVGWNEGVEQSEEIFATNLNRLTRDLNGMILYRKLLRQNMVSAPFVAEANLGVTGGGANMRINDRVLRITTIPELKPDSKEWQPVISEQKDAPPLPNSNSQ